ncbi:MAG: TlpA family protein disulfide reductase [Actinomycetota bacterium]
MACSSDPVPPPSAGRSPAGEKMTPVLVSSELVVGDNRVVLGLLDENDAPAADPDIDVVVAPLGPDGEPGGGIRTDFVWSLKPVVGVYVTNMTFPSAGTFEAVVQVRGENVDQTTPLSLDVAQEGTTPPLGGAAPSIDTPTGDTPTEIERISTDNDPDPRFYAYSIADALNQSSPFVIVFATPKFCTSQVCGPTLDTVKDVSREFKDVNFVHVEPYELPVDPSKPEIVPAGEAWGLPSEPYVFVVDAKGRVAAKYEGVVGAVELTEQLRELTRR